MRVSVVVTTFDWPEALHACLLSLVAQVERPFEVIVADDGSGEPTRACIASWQQQAPFPIKHVWQENNGFQLSKIRNKAIAASTGDYIVMLDGDMIAEKHFVLDHCRFARKSSWSQGMRALTSASLTTKLLRNPAKPVTVFTSGIERKSHILRIPVLCRLLSTKATTNQHSIRGCNQGFWRDDLVRVNGWNEEMIGWGLEDNEIAIRLYRAGVKKRELRFGALALHLDHPRRTPDGSSTNEPIYQQTLANDLVRVETGIYNIRE